MRWMILAAALSVTAAPVGAKAAQIYKWVDAQGVTHFDAQPPAGQTVQEIETQKPVDATPAAAPRSNAVEEQHAADAKVKRDVAAQEAKRKASCASQRNNLALLQNNPRVREEVNGEFRRFTEEERQGRIAEVKTYLDENCN